MKLPMVTVEDVMTWEPCLTESEVRELAEPMPTPFHALDVLNNVLITPKDRLWVVVRKEMVPSHVIEEFVLRCIEHTAAVVGLNQFQANYLVQYDQDFIKTMLAKIRGGESALEYFTRNRMFEGTSVVGNVMGAFREFLRTNIVDNYYSYYSLHRRCNNALYMCRGAIHSCTDMYLENQISEMFIAILRNMLVNAADCGHTYEPHGIGTGYATCNVDGEKRTLCYQCANLAEALEMAHSAHFMAYLSNDGQHVTTWTGGILGRVVSTEIRASGFGGVRHYLSVVALDGSLWYGNSPGRHMYARLHRRKGKK